MSDFPAAGGLSDEFTPLEELFEQSAQGPWQAHGQVLFRWQPTQQAPQGQWVEVARFHDPRDCAFTAQARQALARAVKEVRAHRSAGATQQGAPMRG